MREGQGVPFQAKGREGRAQGLRRYARREGVSRRLQARRRKRMIRKLFFQGRICDEKTEDLDSIISDMRSRQEFLHGLRTDDIMGFFDELGKSWSKNPEIRKVGISHLADFLSRKNLTAMLDTAIRNRLALDGFAKLDEEGKFYHAQPRGLAVHLAPGAGPPPCAFCGA